MDDTDLEAGAMLLEEAQWEEERKELWGEE